MSEGFRSIPKALAHFIYLDVLFYFLADKSDNKMSIILCAATKGLV